MDMQYMGPLSALPLFCKSIKLFQNKKFTQEKTTHKQKSRTFQWYRNTHIEQVMQGYGDTEQLFTQISSPELFAQK